MHISMLHKVVARGEFSLKMVKADGSIVSVDRCVCTSFHSSGLTMNIKCCESAEIRKINRYTIIELNNEEIYL